LTESPNIPDARFRILNWIGIIEQLARTRATHLLAPTALTFPQFIVLNHFSHRPNEGKTVSSIAEALQQNQPAMTKTVQALLKSGLLRAETDTTDRRVKWLYLTSAGAQAHSQAITLFSSDLERVFAGWEEPSLHRLFSDLDRLKVYLDANR